MSFFIRKNRGNTAKGSGNKRKIQKFDKKQNDSKNKNRKQQSLNEEISSDSDEEEVDLDDNQSRKRRVQDLSDQSFSDGEEETAQEKKLRLAKKYLQSIEAEERLKNDSESFDNKLIADRLRDDILEQSGRLHRNVADNYTGADTEAIVCLKNGHKSSVTCVVITSDQKYVFSVSKDCTLIKWDLESNRKTHTICGIKKSSDNKKPIGHSAHILSMAISSDDKFLATGCVKKIINIWDPMSMKLLKTFSGHRGPVSGLAFRKEFHQLFSACFDRSVKVWNLDEMSYVETLFGHQDSIISVDSFMRDRAITCGGRDSTVRIWKIPEESQLVFHGSKQSIDCVKLIDEQHFVTGDDNGSISIWGVLKKKSLTTYPIAHGMGVSAPNWVTALAVVRNTDLIASGSSDGLIRLWKCSQDFKKLEPILNIPVTGFVNSLEFSSDGKKLIVGLGKEHRLGRWFTIKEAKNSILIIPLLIK